MIKIELVYTSLCKHLCMQRVIVLSMYTTNDDIITCVVDVCSSNIDVTSCVALWQFVQT